MAGGFHNPDQVWVLKEEHNVKHLENVINPKSFYYGSTTRVLPACLVVSLTLGLLAPTAVLTAEPATADPVAAANALSQAFRNAAMKATPSVVVVRSETKARNVTSNGSGRDRGENPFRGTPFEDFFRDGMPDGFNVPNGRERHQDPALVPE